LKCGGLKSVLTEAWKNDTRNIGFGDYIKEFFVASDSMAAVTRKSLLVLMLSNLGNIYYLATIFMRRGS